MGKIILLLVLMIGIISGGPKQVAPIDEDHVVGSIPVLVETCNATAIETVTCDRGCLQQDYNILRTELPGTLLSKRFNNDKYKCTTDPNNTKCKKYTLKEVSPKTCVDTLVAQSVGAQNNP